ncbi:HAD family hydrolase [Trinickia acidisoli]|uniref:HAD family hydrolase n=1 Tax=Trinickia acidisoli TaxID=2767482 RepID=UPI001A8F1CD7|nr:HAD family hydrolase [Trinickia acidisoli]
MKIKSIFFDVANTLLYKPGLYPAIHQTLSQHGISISFEKLLLVHRLLSDVITFPDRTSSDFYRDFNSHLLRSFGVVPCDELLNAIFSSCSYLPWRPFPDTASLAAIKLPMGIVSNWDTSLREKLALLPSANFTWILGSEEQGVRKPAPDFFTRIFDISGLRADEIIYVGDSIRLDIEPALNLGIKTILLDRDDLYGSSTAPRIRHLGELVRWLDAN